MVGSNWTSIMKIINILYILSIYALVGCSMSETYIPVDSDEVFAKDDAPTFHAKFADEAQTKTYLNEKGQLRWVADDRVSIFVGKTFNQEYRFIGETGSNNGAFSMVGENPGFVVADKLQANYAVYPHSKNNMMDKNGTIMVLLPEIQNYEENSFGLGANTMVAVTEDKDDLTLSFKNVCGYLKLSFWNYITVKSIKLCGNNGEKLAGDAKIIAAYEDTPTISMEDGATTSITLNCGEGVKLGSKAEDAVSFYFVLPPVVFSKGINVTLIASSGESYSMSTTKPLAIERNRISTVASRQIPDFNIKFSDDNFKAYCVKNFDTNSDGEISCSEASVVKWITCGKLDIQSLDGLKYFTALENLFCYRNQLMDLDVTHNTSLTVLLCFENKLRSLDVSHNHKLRELSCSENLFDALDISENVDLKYLSCSNNDLSSINVSNNSKLETLYCHNNQLTNLDVSKNPELLSIECYANQLTKLDVSKNPNLNWLYCFANQLKEIDVSNNSLLSVLECSRNFLSTLDIRKNLNLERLQCTPMNGASDKNLLKTLYIPANHAYKDFEVPSETSIISE